MCTQARADDHGRKRLHCAHSVCCRSASPHVVTVRNPTANGRAPVVVYLWSCTCGRACVVVYLWSCTCGRACVAVAFDYRVDVVDASCSCGRCTLLANSRKLQGVSVILRVMRRLLCGALNACRLSHNPYVRPVAIVTFTALFSRFRALVDLGLSYTGMASDAVVALSESWANLPRVERLR